MGLLHKIGMYFRQMFDHKNSTDEGSNILSCPNLFGIIPQVFGKTDTTYVYITVNTGWVKN